MGVRVGRWPFLDLGPVSASPSVAQGQREGPLSHKVSSALGSFLTMFRTFACTPSPGMRWGSAGRVPRKGNAALIWGARF